MELGRRDVEPVTVLVQCHIAWRLRVVVGLPESSDAVGDVLAPMFVSSLICRSRWIVCLGVVVGVDASIGNRDLHVLCVTPKQDPFSVARQHVRHLLAASFGCPAIELRQRRIVEFSFSVSKVLESVVFELVALQRVATLLQCLRLCATWWLKCGRLGRGGRCFIVVHSFAYQPELPVCAHVRVILVTRLLAFTDCHPVLELPELSL